MGFLNNIKKLFDRSNYETSPYCMKCNKENSGCMCYLDMY